MINFSLTLASTIAVNIAGVVFYFSPELRDCVPPPPLPYPPTLPILIKLLKWSGELSSEVAERRARCGVLAVTGLEM